jgi:hypothetical protein
MAADWKLYGYEMCVKVEDNALHVIIDAETAEFLVSELPKNDEVTKMIAKGAVALACLTIPECVALVNKGDLI